MPYYIELTIGEISQEIPLPKDRCVSIGTQDTCDVLLNKQLLCERFGVHVERINDTMWLYVTHGWYVRTNGAFKQYHVQLINDQFYKLEHPKTAICVRLSVMLMGNDRLQQPMHAIPLLERKRIVFGATFESDIALYQMTGEVRLLLTEQQWVLQPIDQRNVLVNGERIVKDVVLKNRSFFTIGQYSFYYEANTLYLNPSDMVRLQHVSSHLVDRTIERQQKHVRVYDMPMPNDFVVHGPSPLPQKPTGMVWRTAVSFIALVVLIGMLQYFTIQTQFLAYGIFAGGVSLFSAVILAMSEAIYYRQLLKKRRRTYQQYLNTQEALLQKMYDHNCCVDNERYLTLNDLIYRVTGNHSQLCEKRKEHDDFLKIRIGTGEKMSSIPVMITSENNDLFDLAHHQFSPYQTVRDAPIILDLKRYCHIGVVGDRNAVLFKTLVTSLVCTHASDDVQCVFVFESEQSALQYDNLRWLPHVKITSIERNGIAYTPEQTDVLLDRLFIQLQDKQHTTAVVLIVYEWESILNHPLLSCTDERLTVIYFQQELTRLPSVCEYILEHEKSCFVHYAVNQQSQRSKVYYEIVDTLAFNDMLWRLGRLLHHDAEEIQTWIQQVSLFELLRVFDVTDIDFQTRWANGAIQNGLKVPIGLTQRHHVQYLDISDRQNAHGPHGLVAGTTGSGKSEFLQSYILSAASLYSPTKLTFLLIDFKGGGLSNQLKDLPHVVGVMTNLDGNSLKRSLHVLQAEVLKRQKQFAKYGVNHIDDYIAGALTDNQRQVLPHLVVVVDEFAQLKMEFPDVMQALMGMARMGRTLGIHLILATQKPSGIVDGQIWSNARFKVCFKVQTSEDSVDMLKSSVATHLTQSGRGYLQVGMNEVFEQFQSAYSTTQIPIDQELTRMNQQVYEVDMTGEKTCIYDTRDKQQPLPLQCDVLVQAIRQYCHVHDVSVPAVIYPELADAYELQEVWMNEPAMYHVPIGYYDNVAQQSQPVWSIDLLQGHVYMTGGRQSGKTTVLQSLLLSVHHYYSAETLQVYVIDCDQLALRVFEKGDLIGGYITPDDMQLCKDLFKFLKKEIANRKQLFAHLGVSQFKQYYQTKQAALPLVVVCIDNIVACQDYFDFLNEELAMIMRDGLSVGIICVLTSPTVNGLSYTLRMHIQQNIGLSGLNTEDYMGLFYNQSFLPKVTQGRALFSKDDCMYEAQLALFMADCSPIEVVTRIATFLMAKKAQKQQVAKLIPTIPKAITYHEWVESGNVIATNMGHVPIGLRFDTVEPFEVSLSHQCVTLIGDKQQQTGIVQQLLGYMCRQQWQKQYDIVVIDNAQQLLASFQSVAVYYETQAKQAITVLETLVSEMFDKPLVVIVHHRDVVEVLLNDDALGEKWLNRLEQGRDTLICTQVANQLVTPFRSTLLHQYLKDKQQVLLCLPYAMNKWYDFPFRLDKHLQDEGIVYAIKSDRVIPLRIFL